MMNLIASTLFTKRSMNGMRFSTPVFWVLVDEKESLLSLLLSSDDLYFGEQKVDRIPIRMIEMLIMHSFLSHGRGSSSF